MPKELPTSPSTPCDTGKAAVFAGWREMDEYMRENAIVGMPAVSPTSGSDPSSTQESVSPDPSKAGQGSRSS